MKLEILTNDTGSGDWVRVVLDGEVLNEGHSLAPCHWAAIVARVAPDVELTYREDVPDEEFQ